MKIKKIVVLCYLPKQVSRMLVTIYSLPSYSKHSAHMLYIRHVYGCSRH